MNKWQQAISLNDALVKQAKSARRWAMRNRSKFNCGDDLAGMCAIASGYLHRLLDKAEIESFLCVNDHHCFLISSGYIVDITATQYGFRPITIIPEDKVDQEFWFIEKRFKTVESLLDYQIDAGWPSDQMVLMDEGI